MNVLHFDSDNCWNRDSRSAATVCHLAIPVTAFRPVRSGSNLQGALLFPLSFNRLYFFYLSLLPLRNKENIFMQINVSWTSMQTLSLGLSYLLIIFYSLMRQKLPIQLNMQQINLEMHLSGSKRESKLNTTNILNDRKVSSPFCKIHILPFLFLTII